MTETNNELLNELNDEVEASQSLPYAWVVNPPNAKMAELKKLKPNYGVFLPSDQAEAAQLNAPDWAEPVEISFGEEENTKAGFLFTRLRFVLLHRSPLIVQEKNQNGGWSFSGLAYNKGQITELGEKEQKEGIAGGYRMRSYYLIVFVDEQNNLLHDIPIKLTLGKGPGASLSNEVNTFAKEIERTFFKLQNLPEQKLSQRAHSLTVQNIKLSYHKSGQNAPFVCPISRIAPAIDDVGKTSKVARRDREVELTGTDIKDLLISKKSETGQKIVKLFEEYKDYFNYPLVAKEENNGSAPSEFGTDEVPDDVPF